MMEEKPRKSRTFWLRLQIPFIADHVELTIARQVTAKAKTKNQLISGHKPRSQMSGRQKNRGGLKKYRKKS
jgi:hypothetical protein